MRNFILWRARFEGPRLSKVSAQTVDEAFAIAYSVDRGMIKFHEKPDGFEHGATCWEPENSDDTLVEVTTHEQRVAFALGCMDHMLEVYE